VPFPADPHCGRPLQSESEEEVCYWQLLNLVASKFERALAAKALLSIVGKGKTVLIVSQIRTRRASLPEI
jgi:hypothetical protein